MLAGSGCARNKETGPDLIQQEKDWEVYMVMKRADGEVCKANPARAGQERYSCLISNQ